MSRVPQIALHQIALCQIAMCQVAICQVGRCCGKASSKPLRLPE
jgi:hypothetical protein